MEIRFSRHARRRIRLYDIPESVIVNTLKETEFPSSGKQELIKDISGFEFPIKIVFDVQAEVITVITAYPLKRRRPR